MTIFEYIMVMVSIVLGFALTQLLRGLAKFLRSDNRELAITLWALFLFLVCLQNWWAYWDMRTVTDWTQFKFVLVALVPITMFVTVELLVPMSTTAETDWRQHYRSVRVWYSAAGAALVLSGTFLSWFLMDVPLWHPYRIMQLALFASFMPGLFSTNEKLLRAAPAFAITSLLVGQAIFRFLPDLA